MNQKEEGINDPAGSRGMVERDLSTLNADDLKHGGDVLAACLVAEGITHVFGIPGGEFLPLLEAIDRWGKKHGLRFIGVRHEQAAGHMADGFARASGRIAACCGTVGPGFMNVVSSMGAAWADNVPVLLIHPQQSPKFEDHHRLQGGLDQLAIARAVVKYQKSVADKNRVGWAARKCFKELFSGRPGPVQLEVREDAFHGEVDDYGKVILEPARYRAITMPAANPQAIKQAANLILGASKPLIVSGGGVTSSGAWAELQELSMEFGIPTITSVMGIGTMSTNHETYVGATLGNGGSVKAAREADLVVALGTKFSYTLGYGKPPVWNPDARVVQVDIDPQMIGKNRPVDVGIVADCKVALMQLNDALKSSGRAMEMDKDWLPSLKEARMQDIATLSGKFNSDRTPILIHRVIADLTRFMEIDDILVVDGGDTQVFTINYIDYMKPRGPRTVLQSIGFGHLGVGIPYAIGAKLACPEKRVFMITGDGSFLFNVQELDTAMHLGIPFVCVIADNCSWGMIKNAEKRKFGKKRGSFSVDLCSDYVAIARGFGCHAERVEAPDQITPALQRAIDSGIPSVIQVPVKFTAPPGADLIASFKNLKF